MTACRWVHGEFDCATEMETDWVYSIFASWSPLIQCYLSSIHDDANTYDFCLVQCIHISFKETYIFIVVCVDIHPWYFAYAMLSDEIIGIGNASLARLFSLFHISIASRDLLYKNWLHDSADYWKLRCKSNSFGTIIITTIPFCTDYITVCNKIFDGR